MINSTALSVDVLKFLLFRLTTCGQSGSGIKLILERHFIIFTSSYQNPYRLYWIVMKFMNKPKFWSTTISNQRVQIKIIIIKSYFSRFLNRTRRQRNRVYVDGSRGGTSWLESEFAFLGYASYNPSQSRVWWHIRHMICPFQMGDFLKKLKKTILKKIVPIIHCKDVSLIWNKTPESSTGSKYKSIKLWLKKLWKEGFACDEISYRSSFSGRIYFSKNSLRNLIIR